MLKMRNIGVITELIICELLWKIKHRPFGSLVMHSTSKPGLHMLDHHHPPPTTHHKVKTGPFKEANGGG
jgi:hypothetical protein